MPEVQTLHGALAVFAHRCQASKKVHAAKNLSIMQEKWAHFIFCTFYGIVYM